MISVRPAVDVVVPAWNSKPWLAACLDALRSQTLPARSIIVVDDASTDGTADWLAEHAGDLRVAHLDRNRGFAAAANRGLELSNSPFVALLNADTRADAEWLEALAGHLTRAPQSVGFAASRMLQLSSPGRIDSAGDQFSCNPQFPSALTASKPLNCGGSVQAAMVSEIDSEAPSPPLSATKAEITWAPSDSVFVLTLAPEPKTPSILELQAIVWLRSPSSGSLAVPIKVTSWP